MKMSTWALLFIGLIGRTPRLLGLDVFGFSILYPEAGEPWARASGGEIIGVAIGGFGMVSVVEFSIDDIGVSSSKS